MREQRRIETRNLRLSDLPRDGTRWCNSRRTAELGNLMEFALTFDGYEYLGLDTLYRLLGAVRESFERPTNGEPQAILTCFALSGLRALLFAEQRMFGKDDYSRIETSDFTQAILAAIATRLEGTA